METKSLDKLLLLLRGDLGVTEEYNTSFRTTPSISLICAIAAQQYSHKSTQGLQSFIVPQDVSNAQDRLAVLGRRVSELSTNTGSGVEVRVCTKVEHSLLIHIDRSKASLDRLDRVGCGSGKGDRHC